MLRFIALLALAGLAACAPQGQTTSSSYDDSIEYGITPPTVIAFHRLPGWMQDDHEEALETFLRSCRVMQTDIWQSVCQKAATSSGQARQFFENNFVLAYPSDSNAADAGLITGYYVPIMDASLTQQGEYTTPVYRWPDNWDKSGIYYTRAQIEDGALDKRGLEILWVADPIKLFFAQVQGSTRVKLTDGRTMRLNFAGKNNQPYTSIGRLLKERGEMDNVTLETLSDWMYAHPDKARALMRENASYIFFSLGADNGEGPIGSQNVPLTPVRSVAVDKDIIPLGTPLYLMTTLPAIDTGEQKPFNRLMIAQDTGSAIKGAVRADVFFGSGDMAEKLAGNMKQPGNYMLLLPKASSQP